MSLEWKDKPIARRRFLGYATAGLGAIISALGRRPVRICLVGTIVIVIGVAGFLMVPQTPSANADSPQLCAQCHQKRYDAWKEGTHGVPTWKEGDFANRGIEKPKCASCHDPHQPQITLLNITKPHPQPAPSPPPPSAEPLIILGISLLLVIVVGIAAAAAKGEGP